MKVLHTLDMREQKSMIHNKWETNKENPTIAPARSLERDSRPHRMKHRTQIQPSDPLKVEEMQLEIGETGKKIT